MSLNYGLGENFRTLVPIVNGFCIFDAIGHTIQHQYPDPPYHAKPYIPMAHISSESVIHIAGPSFRKALPEDSDDGVIEYYVTTFSSSDGTVANTKIAEYRPRLGVGTTYSYSVGVRVRVGDFISQSVIDGFSAFLFCVRRKADNGKPAIGDGGNEMSYVIMSPSDVVV